MKNWKGIMKVLEIQHLNRSGDLLYKEKNILNTLHAVGEEFLLKVLFAGQELPSEYFVGLDSRTTISSSSAITDISGYEPTSNSYERQSVDSNNFEVASSTSGYQAKSPTLVFRAIGGSWGPVKNIFLATGLGYGSGVVLVSSATLGSSITVSDGEIVTMRMAMTLSNC